MKTRRTVALMVRELGNEFFDKIVEGVEMAANEKNFNLLVIVGGVFGGDNRNNVQYYLAGMESVDAIICPSGSIFPDDEGYEVCARAAKGKQILLIADKYKDYTSLCYDNASGMRDVMDYLIREKECERIIMFGGPEHSSDANERIAEYRRIMDQHRFKFEDTMLSRGDYTENCIDKARELIENNPGAEAIICGNDRQAEAVYRILKEKDMEIGKDIYVVGFDDTGNSQYMDPPLASVRATTMTLGYEAGVLAGRMGEGENASDKVLKCSFIKRESVGFDPYRALVVFEQRRNVTVNTVFDVPALTRDFVSFIFTGDEINYQSECQKKLLEDFFYRLLNRYLGNVVRRRSFENLDYEMSNIFERGGTEYIDCRRMFRVLDSIYAVYCSKEISESSRRELVNLIARVKRKVVDSLERRSSNMKKVMDSMHWSIVAFSDAILEIPPDSEHKYEAFMKALPLIGIINASLFEFEKPVLQEGDDFDYPEKLYLKAYRDRRGIYEIDEAHQLTRSADIMDYRYMEGGRNHTFFTMGLHYGRYQMGVLLVDIDEEYYTSYSLINNQIDLALSHFIIDPEVLQEGRNNE